MPLPKHLSGPQTIQLRDILKKMFTLLDLDDFLRAEFDVEYDDFSRDARNKIYRDVVVYFNNRSQIPIFLSKARIARPDEDNLLLFIRQSSEDSGLASSPAPKRLTGPQTIQLRDILKQIFTLSDLDAFLRAEFDVRYDDFTSSASGARDQICLDVVVYFNNRSHIPILLSKARIARPDDDDLLVFIQEISGLASLPPSTVENSQLERTIREANSLLNPRVWIKRLAAIENQVCRIEVPIEGDFEFGSGFLVAPDVVITNYHVVEHVIDGTVNPADVSLRFDYAILEDGVTPNPGTIYRLDQNWLIDHSEYSTLDTQENPTEDPQLNQLDYALLRVAGAPGNAPVGGEANKMPNPQPRSWIRIPAQEHQFAPQGALYIMQHPEGKELKLALDTDAIISINGNGTRVRYKTNTEPGSSGSPCFDANWNLVALHHAGDPNYDELHHPEYNQGIPFIKIVELLKQRGKDSALGG